MLKEILSVSGKSGLFKLISQGKNMFVAESLIDNKRIPVYARDKVVSLGDIAIYTEEDDVPLETVFATIKEKENGAKIELKPNIQPNELRAYFKQILPGFDEERVYPSDIKKVMAWYNIIINAGINDFNANKSEEIAENKEESSSPGEE